MALLGLVTAARDSERLKQEARLEGGIIMMVARRMMTLTGRRLVKRSLLPDIRKVTSKINPVSLPSVSDKVASPWRVSGRSKQKRKGETKSVLLITS